MAREFGSNQPENTEEKFDFEGQKSDSPYGNPNAQGRGFTLKHWEANFRKNHPDAKDEEVVALLERFKNEATGIEASKKTSLFSQFKHGVDKKTSEDLAYEHSLMENADFKRRESQEFQEWQKMLAVVVENLKKKRDDPEGEGKEIRPLILALGGGMKGPYGAGQVIALNRLGFTDKFDTAVGISAGACDLAYFLGGEEQSKLGTSLYYEECTQEEFLNLSRVKQIMNVEVVSDNMAAGKKKLDTDAINANPTDFFVQATTPEGEPVFIDAKNNNKGIVTAVHASMALPFFYRKTVEIDGGQYVDGAFEPFPIEEVIKRFKPTDIIVLPQTSFEDLDSVESSAKFSRMLAAMIPHRGSLNVGSMALLEKALKSKEGLRKALEFIGKEQGVNIGILYPPDAGLTPISTNSEQIKEGVLAAAKNTCEVFGEPEKFKEIHLL